MSDRIAVMNRGKVEQLGSPEDLYDRPATPFVADFIGTTNLLRGTVESIGGGRAVVRLDTGDRCAATADGAGAGSSIELSVRPESIALRAAPGDQPASTNGVPEDAALRARVEQVAYLGASVQYQLRTDGGLALAVLSSKAGTRFASGDIVEATWAATDSLVLGRGGDGPSEES